MTAPVSPSLADLLPDDVAAVLREAAEVIASRGAGISVSELVSDAPGIRRLLTFLGGAASLRTVTARRMSSTHPTFRSGSVAAGLIDPDPEIAGKACAEVENLLEQASSMARQARRRAKRSIRSETAEERRRARETSRLDEVRKARDLAQQRWANAVAENRELADKNGLLHQEVADLRNELSLLRDQALRDREAGRDSQTLAGRLAAALNRHVEAAVGTDTRDVQAGEPRKVGVGMPVTEPVKALLLRAAQVGGVPVEAQTGIDVWLPAVLEAFANPRAYWDVRAGADLALTVDVLGGGREIGGSCVLIEAGGTRILVDAGARPHGSNEQTLAPRHLSRALDGPLDAVIVTHAHHDHAGWVPVLASRFPALRVIGTSATRDLLRVMWADSAKIHAARAAADDGGDPTPFTHAGVAQAISRFECFEVGQSFGVGVLGLELFPAGHIVGAAGVVVRAGDRRVVVSGDVSLTPQSSVGGLLLPESAKNGDILLLESTYAGVRKFTPRARAVDEFIRKIGDVVTNGGRVLVPAFALGRAQEIALILGQHLPGVAVLVDGMARQVSEVYEQQESPDGSRIRIFGDNVRRVRDRRREFETFTSGVIVATSGMLTAGPAVEWADRILREPQSALMVVGYQDEESPGRQLLDLASSGGGDFDLVRSSGDSSRIRVACHVDAYQLGAHASAEELVTITRDAAAAEVMLVHGEHERQREFERRLALRSQATADAGIAWRPGRFDADFQRR